MTTALDLGISAYSRNLEFKIAQLDLTDEIRDLG
jgi:hypothetical protein